jgi:hypothetical protein
MRGIHRMKVVRISLLIVSIAVLGLARDDASHAAPLPQFSGGIPPFVWSLTAFPGVGPIADPGRYTVQFMADGQSGSAPIATGRRASGPGATAPSTSP